MDNGYQNQNINGQGTGDFSREYGAGPQDNGFSSTVWQDPQMRSPYPDRNMTQQPWQEQNTAQQSWTGQNIQQPGAAQDMGGQGIPYRQPQAGQGISWQQSQGYPQGVWQQGPGYPQGAWQQQNQGYPQGAYQQQNQGYPQGAYQQPVVVNELENKKDGLAVTSLVLGILGIIFCWCIAVPIIICLVGLIMGIVSLVKTGQHSGIALGGVITSAVGLVLSFALLLLFMA